MTEREKHVIAVGHHRAALDYARAHGLQPHQWTSASSPDTALHALMGRDPDDTEVVHVHGSETVWTPEVADRYRILEALRTARKPQSDPQ